MKRNDHLPQRATVRGAVLDLLADHAWHTTPDLLRVGGHRFSDAVHQLRKLGHLIDTRIEVEGERYSYRLRPAGEGPPEGAEYVRSVMDPVKRGRNMAAARAVPQRSLRIEVPEHHCVYPSGCRCTTLSPVPHPRCKVHRPGTPWPPRCSTCGKPLPWPGLDAAGEQGQLFGRQ